MGLTGMGFTSGFSTAKASGYCTRKESMLIQEGGDKIEHSNVIGNNPHISILPANQPPILIGDTPEKKTIRFDIPEKEENRLGSQPTLEFEDNNSTLKSGVPIFFRRKSDRIFK